MSNRISVAKVGKAMVHFEKTIEHINRKIDERTRNGKIHEDDDAAVRNYSGINNDGERCWSF